MRKRVGLRRTRQFAVIEAPSSQRVRLGLVLKGTAADEGLRAVGGTCNHAVDMTDVDDVELIDWLRNAYHAAA